MPRIVYYIGSALLWLIAAGAIAWWALTAIQVYEVEWAVLACAVVLIPGLFVAYVLQRIWTWLWISWNTRKAMARRLSLERGATTYHPADGEAVDQQWRNHLNSKNE
jgi:type VI protein secretion system component VasK